MKRIVYMGYLVYTLLDGVGGSIVLPPWSEDRDSCVVEGALSRVQMLVRAARKSFYTVPVSLTNNSFIYIIANDYRRILNVFILNVSVHVIIKNVLRCIAFFFRETSETREISDCLRKSPNYSCFDNVMITHEYVSLLFHRYREDRILYRSTLPFEVFQKL